MNRKINLTRRAWLLRIVQGFSVIGLSLLAYPFVRALFPGSPEAGYLEVDCADLLPGEYTKVLWLGRSVMVLRRYPKGKALGSKSGSDTHHLVSLKDPDSSLSVQPSYAQNSHRSRRPDIFVFYSNCTHLGCEVAVSSELSQTEIICPCHQSRFDDAGRVLQDAVASYNLEIPFYRQLSKNRVRLQSHSY
jgi:ubiquinol-cytochrome c reductase iron-sulfur subunit